jgi:hypothetical protein
MVKFNKFQSSLVILSGSSSVDALINEIVSYVKESIKNISPDRIDPSLLRFICNIVENSYSKKSITDNKINKKKIVVDVYIILKPNANTADDRAMLDRMIEDFHSSGQILKVSRLKYYYKLLKNQLFAKKD